MDTITIDGVTYGPPIPHDPTPVTLSDGTVVQPVCPWPDVVGVVKLRVEECWDDEVSGILGDGYWGECGEATITAYRLPADHHAYGDRRSSRGKPDEWANAYPYAKVGFRWRSKMDCDYASNGDRIGIWRIYKKGEAK